MIYLDYNATAPMRPEIKDTIVPLLDLPLNASSIHQMGREAHKIIENARENLAELCGTPATQIIFNSGATEGNNTILNHFKEKTILVSSIEHPSVLEAAHQAERIPVTREGLVDLSALEALLKKKQTALVSVMMVNNETGVIQPIKEISALVHKYGALLHCDGVQAAGRINISMPEMGIDFLTLSSHKIGGPQGVGALAMGFCGDTPILLHGGGQEKKARAGTENVVGIAGFGKAAELAFADLPTYKEKSKWQKQIEEILSLTPDMIIHGISAPRIANTTFFSVSNITKVGNKRSLFGDLTIGTNYLKKLSLSTTLGDKKKGIIFSGYGGKQDSYVKQTSWKNYGFFLKGDYNLSIGKFNILSALSHKEFGLNNYYSENFDNEWEETDSLFIKLGYEKKFDYINIFCNLGFKRYKDHFILDYDNPKFYQNKHNSNIFSTNCGSKIKTILGDTTVGVELLFNSINSETLGDHSETIKTIFFTHKYQYNYWLFTFASSLLIDNEYTILSPSLELGYSVKNVGKLFISIGQGVRSPTYTEKYYNSPVNSGDPNLNYEVINSIETGFFYSPNIFQFKGAMFYRKGENLIDWVKSSDDIVWKVDNITSIKSYGLELESSLKYKGILISSSYLIEKVEGNYNGMESKYGLNYPEKQFLFSFISSKPYPFKEIIDIKYLKVNKQKSYILFDIGFSIVTHNSEFIFKINNLFDQNYYKLSGIKGKGIEYMFTYKVNISQL